MRQSGFHLVWIWSIALCLAVVQGACGRMVWCIGCADAPLGIALSDDACSTTEHCCNDPRGADGVPLSEESPEDCGCLDLTYDENETLWTVPTTGQTSDWITPSLAVLLWEAPAQIPNGRARLIRRSNPPEVRLLNPEARRTILLI